MNKIRRASLAFGLSIIGAGSAFAVDCGSGSVAPSDRECNPAAARLVVAGAPIRQMLAVSSAALPQRGFGLGGGPLAADPGLRGGGLPSKWNFWASSELGNQGYAGAGSALGLGGDFRTAAVGGDYALGSGSAVGLSASYDDASVRPELGNGVRVASTGINVAPYFAHQFSPNISMDASAGVGWGSQRRYGEPAPAFSGDTDRRFAGLNLNSGHWFGNLQIAGRASAFYAHQRGEVAGFDGEGRSLVQGRLGVQTAYWVGNGFMPYAGLTYVNDIARSRTYGLGLDNDGFVAGVGLNYFSKAGLVGGISYTSELGRHDITNNILRANVNLRF